MNGPLKDSVFVACPRAVSKELNMTTYSEFASGHCNSPVRARTIFARALGSVKRAVLWPVRVIEARRELEMLAVMSEYELKDIGLTRSDLGDATALPADASPTNFLAERIEERHRARN
jgi:uncharacterized protein YjiS (DUF1127 family)